jgi:hypothetical protein
MESVPRVAMRDFFTGLTEQTFESRFGIADPPLVDYLAELLARFVSSDSIFHFRTVAGQKLDQVADMVVEAEARVGSARRELHRHIGDFTLFWTGVYPEALPYLQAPDRKDYFVSYCDEGKRAYRLASALPSAPDDAVGPVLERLSHEYQICVQGLSIVRKEWEQQLPGDGRVILVS